MALAHKIRLFLMCIGIFVGVFVFSTSDLLVSSFYATKLREVNSIPENALAVFGSENEEAVRAMKEYLGTEALSLVGFLGGKRILSTQLPGERELMVNGQVYGIVQPVDRQESTVTGSFQHFCVPAGFRILKGRNLVRSDITDQRRVAVIDAFTEKLLFEDGEALGKTIQLSSFETWQGTQGSPGGAFTVVGVCESSYFTEQNMEKLKEDYHTTEGEIRVTVPVYIPYSVLPDEETARQIYLFSLDSPEEYRKAVKAVGDINRFFMAENSLTYTSRETVLGQVNSTLLPLKAFFNIILAVTLLISGLLIMSIMTFSMKERIPEIGIRKAFGAGGFSILFQYLSEVLLIALLISAVGFGASYGFAYLIRGYMKTNLFLTYELSGGFRNFAKALLVGVTQSMVFAAIPCILAARVQVVRALKFD